MPRANGEYRVRLTLTNRASVELTALHAHLTTLQAQPAILLGAVRLAAIATLIAAYRKRLETELPRVLADYRAQHTGRKLPPKLVEAFAAAGAELGPLAKAVVAAITDDSLMGQSGRTLGIGPMKQLNMIHTPSATPHLTGKASNSSMVHLWRTLEFGSGLFSTDPEGNPGSIYSEGDGSWWFGRERGRGLHFNGIDGMQALFNADGLPYDDDALLFETRVAMELHKALIPRV